MPMINGKMYSDKQIEARRNNMIEINRRGKKKCEPDCPCGRHARTKAHNELISRGVRRANAARRARSNPPT